MIKFIENITAQLPLKIVGALADDTLVLWGNEWSFNTSSPWRILRQGRLVSGCWDDDINSAINALIELSVVDIQIRPEVADLTLMLSDQSVIEIFSVFREDSWIMKFGDKIYVAP